MDLANNGSSRELTPDAGAHQKSRNVRDNKHELDHLQPEKKYEEGVKSHYELLIRTELVTYMIIMESNILFRVKNSNVLLKLLSLKKLTKQWVIGRTTQRRLVTHTLFCLKSPMETQEHKFAADDEKWVQNLYKRRNSGLQRKEFEKGVVSCRKSGIR